MSYKRVKKELVETFNLNSQLAFEKFINEGIYKLVTEQETALPNVNIEKLANDYSAASWLVYVGVLKDLSRLPLTKAEQKILDDIPQTKLETDFELYKAFENAKIETVLLYAILYDEIGARRYLDNLHNIKISVTGKDLQLLGLKPSPKYQEIFDEVLKAKLQNPDECCGFGGDYFTRHTRTADFLSTKKIFFVGLCLFICNALAQAHVSLLQALY